MCTTSHDPHACPCTTTLTFPCANLCLLSTHPTLLDKLTPRNPPRDPRNIRCVRETTFCAGCRGAMEKAGVGVVDGKLVMIEWGKGLRWGVVKAWRGLSSGPSDKKEEKGGSEPGAENSQEESVGSAVGPVQAKTDPEKPKLILKPLKSILKKATARFLTPSPDSEDVRVRKGRLDGLMGSEKGKGEQAAVREESPTDSYTSSGSSGSWSESTESDGMAYGEGPNDSFGSSVRDV